RLSGMAQTAGYLLAAAGPFLIGALHEASGSWSAPLLVLLIWLVPETFFAWHAARPGAVGSAERMSAEEVGAPAARRAADPRRAAAAPPARRPGAFAASTDRRRRSADGDEGHPGGGQGQADALHGAQALAVDEPGQQHGDGRVQRGEHGGQAEQPLSGGQVVQ